MNTDMHKLIAKLVKQYSKTEVERWILDKITSSVECDGAGFARNIESTGMIYYTVTSGIYKDEVLPYLEKKGRVTEYVIGTKEPLIINSLKELPPGTRLRGKYEGERVMIIPLVPDASITGEKPKVHGIVLLARLNKDFTDKDYRKAKTLQREISPILDAYLHATYLKKIRQITQISRSLIRRSITENTKFYEIVKEYIKLGITFIDAADRGNAMARSPHGVQYIAAVGYDEDTLLNIPPIPLDALVNNKLLSQLYNKLLTGNPIILTGDTFKEIIKAYPQLIHIPNWENIHSVLLIPVTINKVVVSILSLTNFNPRNAFDDMDIEIAKCLATYMTASYEIIKRNIENEQKISLITNLTTLIDNMSTERPQISRDLMKNIVVEITKVLNAYSILSTTSRRFPNISILYGVSDKKLISLFKELVRELDTNNKDLLLFTQYPYYILVYRTKPMEQEPDFTVFLGIVRYREAWEETDIEYFIHSMNLLKLLINNIRYFNEILNTQEDVLALLGKALEMRDLETKGHTERTAYITSLMAERLSFPDKDGIIWGAYVHDIGKIAIPDRILLKPGKLTKEEFEIIKQHVIYGYKLIEGIRRLPSSTKNVVLYHHEWWNGKGYPHGLKGEEIPLEARIFTIVDVFDALISKRPYKDPWPFNKAIEEIKRLSGVQFDPEIVEVFLEIVNHDGFMEKLDKITKKAQIL